MLKIEIIIVKLYEKHLFHLQFVLRTNSSKLKSSLFKTKKAGNKDGTKKDGKGSAGGA